MDTEPLSHSLPCFQATDKIDSHTAFHCQPRIPPLIVGIRRTTPIVCPYLCPWCVLLACRRVSNQSLVTAVYLLYRNSLTSRQFRYRRSGISSIHCASCGNLGEDGTLRYTKTGKAWLSFPVAVDNQVTEGDNTTTWVRAREKTQCSAKSACSSMFLNRWPSRCVESPPLPPWQRHPKASK